MMNIVAPQANSCIHELDSLLKVTNLQVMELRMRHVLQKFTGGKAHLCLQDGSSSMSDLQVEIRGGGLSHVVMVDHLEGASFLLCCSYRHMFPLGLCQYLEDWYVFSLGLQHFSLVPFPQDAPTPVPLLLFDS